MKSLPAQAQGKCSIGRGIKQSLRRGQLGHVFLFTEAQEKPTVKVP